jgi:site-specific DNA recombinase
VSSNLEKAIEKGLEIASKLSTVWASSDFTAKQKLQYPIFPEGIMYDKKNNTVRTTRINSLFAPISLLADILDKNKTGNHQNSCLLSGQVGMTERTNSL